jgi:hypothetical protein
MRFDDRGLPVAGGCGGLPHFVWFWMGLRSIIRTRTKSVPAQPYIARFSIFSRLIWRACKSVGSPRYDGDQTRSVR